MPLGLSTTTKNEKKPSDFFFIKLEVHTVTQFGSRLEVKGQMLAASGRMFALGLMGRTQLRILKDKAWKCLQNVLS